MIMRIVSITLLSAALFSSYSSAIAADIRPEVARPLNDARVLANGWGDRAAIMAKLNQAASVPNLSKDELHQIRATGEYAFARAAGRGYVATMALQSDSAPPSTSGGVGYTGLH